MPSWSIYEKLAWLKGMLSTSVTDLEPLLAATVAACEISSALVQPHHDWTLLVSPLGPDSSDFAASSNLGREVCRGTAVAHDLLISDGQGRVVVWPLALDGLRRRGW